ncbi:MAG: UDP-glucose/GDP-mannose dehydrogenase family protein [Actinobacteria bacterium]|nr:UDP-glucose/GDP-mannose dehydrogenase family protein [Actinomycetota bacterium]
MSDSPGGGNARARIGVLGLWHLGSVTAACLAEGGFDVTGLDPDPDVVADLAGGRPPVAEPGLAELIAGGLAAGNLRFATPDAQSLAGLDVLWVAFDTPVDEEDRVDTDFVVDHVEAVLAALDQGTLVVTSSQLPVGTVAGFEAFAAEVGRADLEFAAVPENLRLGKALDSFRAAERFVAGVRSDAGREALAPLLEPFAETIEWMGVESAEMTKHALNGFLAASVAYINEIATISEAVGADAAEVSRGLKSDVRIGPRAYLGPGDAFAGGTLARDITTLRRLASANDLPDYMVAGVAASNDAHRRWARRVLADFLGGEGGLAGTRVGVWGLAYKPGTDTLRRSSSLELCRWLRAEGAEVSAHDPAVAALPAADAAVGIEMADSALGAANGTDALVVSTVWPEYREIGVGEILGAMRGSLVVDAAGHLAGTVGADPAATYVRVGVRPR